MESPSLEVVGSVGHDRVLLEVLRRRRRRHAPLQGRPPQGLPAKGSPLQQAAEQVHQHQHQAGGQDPAADRGGEIERGELGQVVVVAARHALHPQHHHGEVGDVKADEHQRPGDQRRFLCIAAAVELGEPVVHGGEKGEAGAAEDDVVEVADDELGVVDMDVGGSCAEDQAGEPADGEEEDEAEGEEHRRFQGDGALVEGGDPVEDLDGRGDGHDEGEEGEDQDGGVAHAAGEHVVPPDQGAGGGDGEAGKGDHLVAEDRFAGEDRDDLRDDPHGRQDHDVDRRVGVDPEEVLVQERVAAAGRVEKAGAEHPFGHDQNKGDAEDRRGQDLYPGGGVERPDEEGQPRPAHALGAQPVDGGDEVEPGEDGGEAEDEDAEDRQGDVGAGAGAEGDIEGPAGVRRAAAGEEGR